MDATNLKSKGVRMARITTHTMLAAALLSASTAMAADIGRLYGVLDADGQMIVRTLDLATLKIEEKARVAGGKSERLNGLFQRSDRSIGVLQTATANGVGNRGRLRNMGNADRVAASAGGEVSGLKDNWSVSSLLMRKRGEALALVSHYSDTPPFFLATVATNAKGMKVTSATALNPVARFAHLTQCPDGAIYATSMAPQWDTRLVKIDAATKEVFLMAEFSYRGKSLRNDVWDLACGPSGRLYALADPDNAGTNSLFAVNAASGELSYVTPYDVRRMAFVK